MESPSFFREGPVMVDPLAEMVAMLQPRAPFSKLVSAAGAWRIRRRETGKVFYCMVLAGAVHLEVDGKAPVTIHKGDFVLVPSSYGFAVSSVGTAPSADVQSMPVLQPDGTMRLGRQDGPVEVQQLVGYCVFGSPDASLLVSLLPDLVVVRGEDRLAALAALIRGEVREQRPARDVILERLLEVLFIEALRSSAGTTAPPGLLQGLADERLAIALRCMHEEPARPWTVAELASRAALSRSAFFARFNRAVGLPPMEYLLTWRMSLAKDLLRKKQRNVAEIAARVGYGSASAFSVAFARHVGYPPARFSRQTA